MNIRDIARIADVTPGTVSKVLNNYPDIGEATRKHVLEIIEQHQYDPKEKARAKKKEKEHSKIGLIMESVYNPVYSQIEDILSILIHNSGYSVVGFHDNYYVQDKTEKLGEMITALEKEKLSGLFYIGGNFSAVLEEIFLKIPCPTVFIHTVLPYPSGKPTYSSIQVSHYDTALNQMRLLIEGGHQNICAAISSFIDNSVYGLRVQGYEEAVRQRPIDKIAYLETDYQLEKAYRLMREHLQKHPETTAICCVADMIAPALLKAIHDEGRKIGKDIFLLSFDGLEAAEYCVPAVSTFAQPTVEIARFAGQLMTGLIHREKEHQHVTFQPVLMKRDTFDL